jgi:hypothetical protein
MVLRPREPTAEERSAIDQRAHARTAPGRRGSSAPASSPRRARARGRAGRHRRAAPARRRHRARLDPPLQCRRLGRAGGPPARGPAADLRARAGRDRDRRRADRAPGTGPARRVLDPRPAGGVPANERKGIAIRRSRIDEILLAEGPRRRRHESWFGARVAPEFAEKRGGSRPPTHGAARKRRGHPPGRDGTGEREDLSRPRRGRGGAAGRAGDRLRPARPGLHLRRPPPRHRRGLHPAVSGTQQHRLLWVAFLDEVEGWLPPEAGAARV